MSRGELSQCTLLDRQVDVVEIFLDERRRVLSEYSSNPPGNVYEDMNWMGVRQLQYRAC